MATHRRSRAAATCERYAQTAKRARQKKTAPCSRARIVKRRATPQAYPKVRAPSSSASATTAPGPARRSAPLPATGGSEAVGPGVQSERRRKGDGAVRLSVGLEQRGDGPGQRHTGSVQRVDQLRFAPGAWPATDVGAARLEIAERARARALQPGAHARGPYLEVVRLRAREAQVSRREQHDAIGKLEPTQHRFGAPGELLVLRRRAGRAAEPHELHFVELVHSQQPQIG